MKDTVVHPARDDRQVAGWLLVCALTVFAMVVLGGVTRLTHSGLPMVDWKPLMGVLPPLSQEAWEATFAQYQQFPEYQKINLGMSLEGFKSIFWFEYAHRVLGRMIGVVFLLPMLYLLARKRIQRSMMPKLIGLFVLGGLQGLMGWYMVMSGLVDDPRVSQYRLTAHLSLAVVIFGYMLWLAMGLLDSRDGAAAQASPAVRRLSYLISSLLFVMILSGGFVAGTRAGLAFGTFPLMGDSFIPAHLYATNPFWLAAFEDVVTIQFNHRMLAYVLCALIGWFAYLALRGSASKRLRLGVVGLLVLLVGQVSLGIATILYHVPVALAAVHQGGALLLFGCSLYVSHAVLPVLSTARVEVAT
jgi:cytochrome c oxidase assembly protein subunit 15